MSKEWIGNSYNQGHALDLERAIFALLHVKSAATKEVPDLGD